MFSLYSYSLVILLSLFSFFFASNTVTASTDEIAELVEIAKRGKEFDDREQAVIQLLALEDSQALYGLLEVAKFHILQNYAVAMVIDDPEALIIDEVVVDRALKIVEPGLGAIFSRFDRATLTRNEAATLSGLGLVWELILDKDMPKRYRERAINRFIEHLNTREPDSPVVLEWAARVRQQVNDDLVGMVKLALGDPAERDLHDYDNADYFERFAFFNQFLSGAASNQFYEVTENQKRLAVDVSFIVLSLDTAHVTEWHASLVVIQFGTAEDLERLISQTGNEWIRKRTEERLAEIS